MAQPKIEVFSFTWRYTAEDTKLYGEGRGVFGGSRVVKEGDVERWRIIVGRGVGGYEDMVIERCMADALGADRWERYNDRSILVSRALMTLVRTIHADRCKDEHDVMHFDLGEFTQEML